MPRIAGVDIPKEKRIEVALTYIIGIGKSSAKKILHAAKVDCDTRTKDLADNEVARLQKVIDGYPTEGEVRKIVRENIQRLKRIGTYQGLRHSQNLPVRGQRTRSNARTKRGKRKTIGAMKKKDLGKLITKQGKKDEEKE
jgi:small subunit ribosomal protein S13